MTDDIVEKHYDAYPFPQILDDKIRERAVKFGKNPLADRSGGGSRSRCWLRHGHVREHLCLLQSECGY